MGNLVLWGYQSTCRLHIPPWRRVVGLGAIFDGLLLSFLMRE